MEAVEVASKRRKANAMVKAYLMAKPGTGDGHRHIMAAIQEFRDQLVVVMRLHHPDRYSFIAVFRERGTIGGFTALIGQGGATSGYRGGGPYDHAQMLSFLDDQGIDFKETYWSDWESDYPEFTKAMEDMFWGHDYYTGRIIKLWSSFLSSYIWHYMPKIKYEPSLERLREVGYEK